MKNFFGPYVLVGPLLLCALVSAAPTKRHIQAKRHGRAKAVRAVNAGRVYRYDGGNSPEDMRHRIAQRVEHICFRRV